MNNSTSSNFNQTTLLPSSESLPEWYGFIGIAIASIGFGTNYLPVKKFETGDGMFFQWIMASSIVFASFIVNAIMKFPKFEPLVMLGGALWATGNVCVFPIIKLIGLGLGILLWGSTTLVIGWASARFGWFGIFPQIPNNLVLNYIGFSFTAISPFIYSMVKTEVSVETSYEIEGTQEETQVKLIENETYNLREVDKSTDKKKDSKKNLKKKILGVALSVIAGVLFGFMFIPVTYVKNRYEDASQNDIDYFFAQCAGIYLSSSFYFLIYCMVKRNQPILYSESILPGVACGMIWFIAYVAYFFANQALSPAISLPIISALPGLIGVVISTVIFKEIRGWKNYVMITAAIIITTIGVVLTGLSKLL